LFQLKEREVNPRAMILLVMGSLALALAFMPQSTAQAETCYDSSKNVIPCPKSNYVQTQKAKKVNGPSATPAVPTETPTATATYTLEPTATLTPIQTATPYPTATQTAALVIAPVKATTQPNACDPRIWPATAGFGVLLAVTGIAAQAIRARSASRASAQAIALTGYSTESKANAENLDVHIGRVDFGDGSGGQNPNPTGSIALTAAGIVLAVGGAAGMLNIIPCSAWLAVAGIGLALAIASVAAALILRAVMRNSIKYTMFQPAGTPTRGTAHVAMKQSSGASSKTESDSKSDDDSDGDDS
jgi:hypothetical protein